MPKHILDVVNSKWKKTLFLKLRGGIGNQLFTYMAGLSLAYQNNLRLVVDTRGIDHFESIQEFNLPGKFLKSRVYWKIQSLFNSGNVDYERLSSHEKENVSDYIRGNCTLQGFFQTPKYFEVLKNSGVRVDIDLNRVHLLFPNEFNSLSQDNSTLIHIRGGDFLDHRQSIGILGEIYYEKVFELIKEMNIGRVHVMTDDIDFAKKILPTEWIPSISFIQKNMDIANFEYLSLFAFPSHIIVSNSTFSWWGAQLAKNGSHVISPETWNRSGVGGALLALKHWETQPSIWF